MRSLLFVPGDSERKLAKSISVGADAVIVDLEDSISGPLKATARGLGAEFVKHAASLRVADGGGVAAPRVFVRINGLHSPYWEDDLRAVVGYRPSGILLPKARNGEDIHRLSVMLGSLEEAHGLGDERLAIMALVTETSQSLFALSSYINASTRLCGLAWGAEDLSAEVGSLSVRDETGAWTSPFRLVRDLTLFAATAAGVSAIDTVYTDIRNLDGLRFEAQAAARDGFGGKLALHPDQVPVINAAFSPDPVLVERAARIVALFESTPGTGVVTLDGQMLDRPHLEKARQLLARSGSR